MAASQDRILSGLDLLTLAGCDVDLTRQRILRQQESIHLTTKECDLLRYLVSHSNQVVSREELLRQVWGYPRAPNTRAVDVAVARLRRKVEIDSDAPDHILTATGVGYRFVPLAEPRASPPGFGAVFAPGAIVIWALDPHKAPLGFAVAGALAARGLPFVVDQATAGNSDAIVLQEQASVLVWLLPTGPLPRAATELVRLMAQCRANTDWPAIIALVDPAQGTPAPPFGVAWSAVRSCEEEPGRLADLIAAARTQPRTPRPTRPPPAPLVPAPQPSALQPPGAAYDRRWYGSWGPLERAATALLQSPGAPLVILGAPGGGKTWLLEHLLASRGEDHAAVSLKLRHAGSEVLRSADTLLPWLAMEIADQLKLDAEVPEISRETPLGARRSLERWVERILLARGCATLWLAWDDADRLRRHSGDDGVFQMLRAWAGRTRPPWDRLRLLLTLSTAPSLLVQRPELSPFNLTPPLRLMDLAPEVVADLAARCGLSEAGPALGALRALVGGHPYLVRLALHALAVGEEDVQSIADLAAEGRGPWGETLRATLSAVRAQDRLVASLRALISDPAARLDPLLAQELCDFGILIASGSGYRFRCTLYEHFLARHL